LRITDVIQHHRLGLERKYDITRLWMLFALMALMGAEFQCIKLAEHVQSIGLLTALRFKRSGVSL